ncbi:MAG: GGDEF domain-containing protein [Clostridiales bacterium 38-18]|nr:MAG: GGDEF domain-containing protein [Clostridiales bacterium 38-18]
MGQVSFQNDKLIEIISIQTEIAQLGSDLTSIMNLVTKRAGQLTTSAGASVELIQEDELVYSAVSGGAEAFLGLRIPIGNSLSGQCIHLKMPLVSHDIEIDERVNKEACRKIGIRSMIVLPLIFKGSVVGILKVFSGEVDHYKEEDSKILELMTGLIAAAMYTAMQTEDSVLFYKATHDSLTGIANRSLFYDRLRQKLAQSLRLHEAFSIISLDMDGLKMINDTYGHRLGDAALAELAARVSGVLRDSDTWARLGGDEFGIIAGNVKNADEVKLLIMRIDNAISMPFEFEQIAIPLRASIGYALFSEDGIELDMLIEKADQAMYASKREKKAIQSMKIS